MNATLEYDLGPGDLEAFFIHHATRAPYITSRNRRMRLLWGGLGALVAVAYARMSVWWGIAFTVLLVTFLALYGPLNRWWYVRQNLRLNAGPDGPRLGAMRVRLDSPGQLLVEGPEGSSRLALSAVRRIEESASHFFIYTGPAAAIIVPKQAGRALAFMEALRVARAA
jgi:hypothetical protein